MPRLPGPMAASVWLCEAVPNNWSGAVLLPLFKKRDKRICTNYRGDSLIEVAWKVLVSSSSKGSNPRGASELGPTQSGFRPGRGCTDPMHSLRRTLEQRWSLCVRFRGQGFPMADNGGRRFAPQTLEAGQGVLLVDQDEGQGKWEGFSAL